MDVTCERCSTAYEFDDALVSERGTTVKCTNCGHQFKVRRPQAAGAPERWLVRTIDGRELEFRALRELQAAIAQAAITRDDVLSRGGSRPRRLGSIAELEPFFVSAGTAGPTHSTSLGLGPRAPVITGVAAALGQAAPPAGRASQPSSPGPIPRAPVDPRVTTAQGIGTSPVPRSSEVSIAIPLPRGPEPAVPQAAPPRRAASGPPGVIVAPAGAPPVPPAPSIDEDALYDDTTRADPTRVRHVEHRSPVAAGSYPMADAVPVAVDAPPARPRAPPRVAARAPADDVAPPTAPFQVSTLLDPAKVRAAAHDDWTADDNVDGVNGGGEIPQNQHTASVPPLAPNPPGVRHSYADDLLEPRFSQAAAPPARPGAARWIVGMVVVGMLALAFATVGRKMLVSGAPPKATESDARIGALLADGEKSLAEGDLDSAKEQFDKASVLGERDPRAAADLARLLATKGDIEWLRVRILPDGDPDQAIAKRELEQAAQHARKVADHAGEVAPTDPAVIRSRIDALRLAGDLAGARKLIGGLSNAQGDNALTRAELDLAEAKPEWPIVIERLRSATSTEGNLGRARAMLVYALARSGDASGARTELDRVAALPHPNPLVNPLRAFVNRTAGPEPSADASAKPGRGLGAFPPGGARAPLEASMKGGPSSPPNRERPAPVEPHTPPGEHPVSPSGEPIDTSDLPGVKSPTPARTSHPSTPAPTSAPAPAPPVPAGVDTSDLPGFK